MPHTTSPLKERLDQLEERVTQLRDERKPLADRAAEAKRKFANLDELDPDSDEYRNASRLASQLATKDAEVKAAEEARTEVLRMLAGHSGPANGVPGRDGFADLVREVDLEAGRTRVSVMAGSLLRPQAQAGAGTDVTLTARPTLQEPPVGQAVDARYLYQTLPQEQVGPENLSVAEFRVTRHELSGSTPVLRDPTDTTEKASLGIGIEYTPEDLQQVAIVVDEVPNAILAADRTLQQLLTTQMRAELDQAIDEHVVDAITAAGPLSGSTGATLVEQLRAAVGSLRAAGHFPTVVAVNPDDSAALDTLTTGSDSAYVFSLDVGATRLWRLSVVEVAAAIEPTVLDPRALGKLLAGVGNLTIDGLTGLERNVSRLRLELNVLAHVVDGTAAYIVSSS